MTITCTKRALRREEGYPVGTPAPMYLICGCGRKVEGFTIDALQPVTCTCGTTYDQRGWVLEVK